MLELHFPPPHLTDSQHLDTVREIIADILAIQKTQGNRAGNQLISDRMGSISDWSGTKAIGRKLSIIILAFSLLMSPIRSGRPFTSIVRHPSRRKAATGRFSREAA